MHGTTTVFTALDYSMDQKRYLEEIEDLREAMKNSESASIGGLYMESPYITQNSDAIASPTTIDYGLIIYAAWKFAPV